MHGAHAVKHGSRAGVVVAPGGKLSRSKKPGPVGLLQG
jgi:hypothetical protein